MIGLYAYMAVRLELSVQRHLFVVQLLPSQLAGVYVESSPKKQPKQIYSVYISSQFDCIYVIC